ncbi:MULTISPECIES: hypothetical protein [Streptomyces]|uniref:Uncharacterized protein n=2 Tax=Streptomyces rimosus subsp. rimosus TaxID=132474 RepID=L8EY79_STRR1|nr:MULTISPECIES: hypothetical protein [Streptomyces]KOG70560.1 hypothetical protein ADK78_28670 [Kitasatospora aureofaciens]MYT47345.1 hypothetical protein [Streptomyces sp. SID5471]KEF04675.1 hypothetical protein DF17_22570 [Streptomyces rimosus]KEF19912.1 hypothetical protein DF18_13800 [Streptomyces rimosus]KOT31384.1 hypothetical protein ADK84_30185 [Streptomyces sp. NRRL WC-3701]
MNIVDPVAADIAQQQGMDDAAAHTDTAWAAECQKGIAVAATLMLPFQAADLVAAGLVSEPRHPNHWGPQFAAAHRNGVIEPHGVARSKRATVRNSLCRTWIGSIEGGDDT